ncbi:Something about silencing protein 10 [Bagarius yarrelli]|uniref:Something about silencing protein 10 n=1 Tax=Bagarius yarrelli TaxID=175774 RepID=A0A556TK68_BAGYA|nr:Something about silencing protein 10 [Bagarius yarrelli]
MADHERGNETLPKRVVRRPKAKKEYDEYDGDDACFKNTKIPDQISSKSIQDEIEHFHSTKISNLFAQGRCLDSDQEDEADEEEVMPLTFEDSDNEEKDENSSNEEQGETDMESDLEEKRDDGKSITFCWLFYLPNDMAWGSKKKMYYDSDYTTKKKLLEEVEAEDKEEEEEAINIQKRLVANLSEEDYDLNLLQFATEVEAERAKKAAEKEQRIIKDLNIMSQKEKLKLLRKECPELLELIQDFKAKLAELHNEIQPIVQMVKDKQIPAGKVSKMAAMQEAEISDSDEEAALLFYRGIEEKLKLEKKNKRLPEEGLMMEQEEAKEESEMNHEYKRGITYQMAKNKGLTPKRKKIDRNPRVKHREKFRQANIRRMGQVLNARHEEQRYSGELSGIRAGVKKSIKLQ